MKQMALMLGSDYLNQSANLTHEFSMVGSKCCFTYKGWRFVSSSLDALLGFYGSNLFKKFASENVLSFDNLVEFNVYVSSFIAKDDYFSIEEVEYSDERSNEDECSEYNAMMEHFAPTLIGSVGVSLDTAYFTSRQVLELVEGKVV